MNSNFGFVRVWLKLVYNLKQYWHCNIFMELISCQSLKNTKHVLQMHC